MTRRVRTLMAAVALAAWAVAGVGTPALQRAMADLLEKTDPQREVDLGREVARQVELMFPLSTDKRLQARVDRVGKAVVEQLETRVYPYQFKVLAVPDYNAFAIPGGFIYVYEGLLDRVPDDNALAFVLAHEVTHVAHRHWAKRTEDMKGVSVLGALAAQAIGGDSDLLAGLASELVYLRYSRDDEDDADQSAMEYLWRAGFDPQGAVAAMQEIVEMEKGASVPRYLRNHPPAADRLKRLQQKQEELKSRPRPAVGSPPVAGAVPVGPPAGAIVISELTGTLPEVELAENPWFPLAVGNRWTFSLQKDGGAKATYTMEVIGQVPLEKGVVYRVVISFGDSSSAHQLLTGRGEVWERSRATDPESKWHLEHVTGVSADAPVVREGWEYRLVTTEAITVPCGTFPEARRIQKRRAEPLAGQPPMTVDMWFVQGVGMVKRVVAETGVTETLTHYQVSAAPLGRQAGGDARGTM